MLRWSQNAISGRLVSGFFTVNFPSTSPIRTWKKKSVLALNNRSAGLETLVSKTASVICRSESVKEEI